MGGVRAAGGVRGGGARQARISGFRLRRVVQRQGLEGVVGRQSGTPRLEGRARGGERAWPMPCPLGLRLLPPQALQQPECHAERDAPSGRRQLPATKLPHNLAELGQLALPS